MSALIIVRHELAANCIGAINALFQPLIVDVQSTKDGDGKTLQQINWGAFTPQFEPHTEGFLPQWSHQDITLELRASVDYRNRSLSQKYVALLQAFEEFCARDDLQTWFTSKEEDGIIVISPPMFEGGSEEIQEGMFVTTYRMKVAVRGKVNGA